MNARKNFEFVDRVRREPHKHPASSRKSEFREIYDPFVEQHARAQAERCIACGNPYCQWQCPLHNHIPDWLKLAAEGRMAEAAELVHSTNPLPEICGRICPQDRLCEGACTLNTSYGAVTIGAVERHIADTALDGGWRPDLSGIEPTGHKVAIVGAGPAGLACADALARSGVGAVVYDAYPEIGGLLSFGIPEFKLENSVIARRRQVLEDMGVKFVLGTRVGRDIGFDELLGGFDAVFLGLGAYRPMSGGIPGEDAAGVYKALDYLVGNTGAVLGLSLPEHELINLENRRAVVLGGGDTAMDCVRTAVRQGASEVYCLYRRDRDNMPGSQEEVGHAMDEGVQFRFNVQALEIVTGKAGDVNAVKLVETRLGPPDETGRKRPEPVEGSETHIETDAVVVAYGFRASPCEWFAEFGITTDEWGRVMTGGALPFQTSNPRVFAAGDMVRGADLVVTAVADALQAARAIVRYLGR